MLGQFVGHGAQGFVDAVDGRNAQVLAEPLDGDEVALDGGGAVAVHLHEHGVVAGTARVMEIGDVGREAGVVDEVEHVLGVGLVEELLMALFAAVVVDGFGAVFPHERALLPGVLAEEVGV